MALKTLTAIVPDSISGAGTQPFVSFNYNALSVTTPATTDQIVTPAIDIGGIAPHCNRVVVAKYSSSANADVLEIQGSTDGITWYDIPQYNSNTPCSLSTAAANVSLAGLPNMRYVRGSVTLVTSVPATMRLVLALTRF